MKKRDVLIFGLASIALVGLTLYTAKQLNIQKKLKKAADEGYETAHDILYPSKNIAANRLKLGPVLPD